MSRNEVMWAKPPVNVPPMYVRQHPGAALYAKWREANPDVASGLVLMRLGRYRRHELTLEVVERVLEEVEDALQAQSEPSVLPAPARTATRKCFLADHGQVRYGPQLAAFRAEYLADALCEIDGCDRGHLVFDHCHEHGWVRAVLCSKHNTWLGHLEAAMREWAVDLSGTPYAPVLAACVGCAA